MIESGIKRLVGNLKRLRRSIVSASELRQAEASVQSRWRSSTPGCAHQLPGRLVVSLTSYPPRFATLHLTLKSLLTQSVAPDSIVLWIAEEDRSQLPDSVLELERLGLQISFCEQLRSYKKLIPTLRAQPDAFIVTADDDVCYWSTWLEELVSGFHGDFPGVRCHRAHKIRLDASGMPLPYKMWEGETTDGTASKLTFPTGVGGVLYPPGSLHPDVLSAPIFMTECPNADDVWFYWMARRSGCKATCVQSRNQFTGWAGTQKSALWHLNASDGGNDDCIARMLSRFGFPLD